MAKKAKNNRVVSFKNRVLAVVKNIPRGKTLSYKQVAEKAGHPKSFRAVGNVLNSNYDNLIPCHRVIRSDGTGGGYNKGWKQKILKLCSEGVNIL